MTISSNIGLANRFSVTVPPTNLGNWSRVDGLDVTFDLLEYRAGDTGNQRWLYPGKSRYENVRLGRAANDKDTPKVQAWLADVAKGKKFQNQTATITLHDAAGNPIATWDLNGAFPIKWSVAGFDAGGSNIALESLEIAHNGFLDDHTTC